LIASDENIYNFDEKIHQECETLHLRTCVVFLKVWWQRATLFGFIPVYSSICSTEVGIAKMGRM